MQKERKNLIAKALAENDDGKYDFQFTRIKQELEQLQAQLEGVQAMQTTQAVDEARMAEIAALLEQFQKSGLPFDDLLVRKVVETVRWSLRRSWRLRLWMGTGGWLNYQERNDPRLTTLLR